MKNIIITVIAALLLAAPAALSANEPAPSSLQDKKAKEKVTVTFKVNMHCENCVKKLTDNLSFLKGVEDLKITLDEHTVVITYNPAKTNELTLRKAIEKCGYTAEKA